MGKYTSEELAKLLEGEISGDRKVRITGVNTVQDAGPGDVASIHNRKYEDYLYRTSAGALIISQTLKVDESKVPGAIIRVADPQVAFAKVLNLFSQTKEKSGIHPSSVISADAVIGDGVYVGPHAVISSGCRIGDGTKIHAGVVLEENVHIGGQSCLYPGVVVYPGCEIGSRCVLHAGVVIGSDGFGFVPDGEGNIVKVPQLGKVVIGNDVEIGANTTIDRATIGATRIGNGVKLDNLIQVGHNVVIGDYTVIAAQTGISGSTELGPGCMVGGQVGFAGHLKIAAYTMLGAQSGVASDITEPGQKLLGPFAFNYREAMKAYALFRRLPDLNQRLKELEEILSLHRK